MPRPCCSLTPANVCSPVPVSANLSRTSRLRKPASFEPPANTASKGNPMRTKLNTALMLAATLAASTLWAQPPTADAPRSPTPRLPDGTVDLSGDGVWNQRWITDFARQMPGYQDGD